MGERAAYTLARGLEQSPTFLALVERLQRSDVVVYIELVPAWSKTTAAGIHFLGRSPVCRFLRVVLSSDLTTPQMVAVLGHELQHALEVADASDVRDHASFVRLYQQAGIRLQRTFDSEAARDVGERIREEIRLALRLTKRD